MLIAQLAALLCGTQTTVMAPKSVVAYFVEWGIYDRQYFVANVPGHDITALNYAFAQIDGTGRIAVYDAWAAIQRPFPTDDLSLPFRGNFNQLIVLKRKFPHLKTLISVGGWTLSGPFSNVAFTAQSRQVFADSCAEFLLHYQFDGVDIDWEYPVSGGLQTGRPEDRTNFTLLLQAVRNRLSQLSIQTGKSYLLTVATAAGPQNIDNIEPGPISLVCDWMNVMTYDFHGPWDNTTDHHSPLDGSSPSDLLNVRDAMQRYRSEGVPAKKLYVGIPIYGKGWRGVGGTNNGLRQPAAGPAQGTWESGTFDYKDVINRLNTQPTIYQRYWDPVGLAPYVYAPSINQGTWITYDDPQSVDAKLSWIRAEKYGGAMLWELSSDMPISHPQSLLLRIAKALRKRNP